MAVIKPTVIFPFDGNATSLPSGWSRETSLDGKYPKGTANGVNPNVTGGNSTHQHSATANHSHSQTAHTHSISFSKMTVNQANDSSTDEPDDNIKSHDHAVLTSGAMVSGGLSSVSAVYASYSNDPPYYTVIFIKPNANTNLIPNAVIPFIDTADVPSGFAFCNGTGTPDLRNRYLKGANTGANAGSTGGGLTNIHDLTHTHSVTAHSHSAVTSSVPTNSDGSRRNNTGSSTADKNHTHSVSLASMSDTLVAGNPSLTTVESVEPAYKKLIPIKNTSGVSKPIKIGMIGMYLGALSSIPANWVLCDGTNGTQDMRDKHLKMANATTEAGNTGGSNTHTHASQDHTHTANSHNHGSPNYAYHSGSHRETAGSSTVTRPDHAHTLTIQDVTSTFGNGSTAGDSQNNEPEYRTVAFIKLLSLPHSGAIFL